jgi:hypothetical protein
MVATTYGDLRPGSWFVFVSQVERLLSGSVTAGHADSLIICIKEVGGGVNSYRGLPENRREIPAVYFDPSTPVIRIEKPYALTRCGMELGLGS